MDTERIGQGEKQHRIRKVKQKQTSLKGQMGKCIKAILILLGIINYATGNQQNFYTPQNSLSNFNKATQLSQDQFIIFDEIGEMASQMAYIHVNIPLNLTALYDQSKLFSSYLHSIRNTTTSEYKRIPFTKAARDTGEFGLRRLERIMKRLKNIDQNLPHLLNREKRNVHERQKRGDQACIWGYKEDMSKCDLDNDVAQMILDPLAAIVEAIRGPKYEDTEKYYNEKVKNMKGNSQWFEDNIFNMLMSPKPDFPEEYWEVFATEKPMVYPTTYKPYVNTGKDWTEREEQKFYSEKYSKLEKIFKELKQEQLEIEKHHNATLPDFYIHNRNKRFLQAISLASDIIGTFMGAFNAYEIQQLKSKFQDLSQGHNMLVRVTQKHDNDINQMRQDLKSIVDVIDLMAEYNPGLLQQQISEQLDMFEDRVTVITNTIQQLHHRRLAVDLLSPDQMEIMHDAVNKIAHAEGFHNQAEKLSDYYQIEVTYTRKQDDIVLMVHVPCIKTRSLFKIYRYLPFPIPIPFTTNAHDLTIKQSLSFQNSKINMYNDLFDQDNLDYPKIQEALFITDTADLIAIDSERNFQVLTQNDLANCVQRNHIYLCDKQHVVKHDLTDNCLGSLYSRMESGVRKHCKFERRPVQEMVFQLTDTEHLVYSPTMQSSTIMCKNSTDNIYLDLITKIKVPENCYVKLSKHTITSTFSSRISSPALQFAWTWDPFTLPSTSLEDPQHLDHMIQELRNRLYNIQSNTTDPEIFDKMLVHSTFRFNYTSIIIWLALALVSILYFTLFIIAAVMYIKHKKANTRLPNPEPAPNSQHLYAPIPALPAPTPSSNQILLQELGNVLVQHHTARPTQVRFHH